MLNVPKISPCPMYVVSVTFNLLTGKVDFHRQSADVAD